MDDEQQRDDQREKADQEILDGSESGVYVPAEAGDHPVVDPQSDDDPRDERQRRDAQAEMGQPTQDGPEPNLDPPQPSDDDPPETLGQKIYAILFLTALLSIGCGVVFVVGGQWSIAMEDEHYHHYHHVGGTTNEEGKMDWFVLFRLPFLRPWPVQFAIGAVFGAVSSILFCLRFWSGKEEWKPDKNEGPL